MEERKLGVVLLNMGGPNSAGEVPAYLLNIFRDPAILDMPLGFLVRPWLSRIIGKKRAAASAARYEQIGGKTPLNEIARQQAAVLQFLLREHWPGAIVAPGMRYWHPFIEDAVRHLASEQVTHVVALSMYPHFSRATTGSCMTELRRAMRRHLPRAVLGAVTEWPRLPQYVNFLARQVVRHLGQLSTAQRSRAAVLFSAHGVPMRLIEKGDPYRDQAEDTFRLVCAKLPPELHITLGWQSAFGPARWLKPDSKTVVAQLAEEGVEHLLAVPLGFAAENIETLWDIEIDLKSWAEVHGIPHLTRMPCPNADEGVMNGLADLITIAAEGITL
jgi:ferrochelatase